MPGGRKTESRLGGAGASWECFACSLEEAAVYCMMLDGLKQGALLKRKHGTVCLETILISQHTP